MYLNAAELQQLIKNLPEATLSANKDFDPVRHDYRVLLLRGRPVFDWDILQGNEIDKEQVRFLVNTLFSDGAFGDDWKASINGSVLTIKDGNLKLDYFILQLHPEENRTLNLIPEVDFEDLMSTDDNGNGLNTDKTSGSNVTFQLKYKNLRSAIGALALPPSGSLQDFRDQDVDFYVQGTNASIVQVDALNGFITFNQPPTVAELASGVYISYHYGKTGTTEIPTLVYAVIKLVRITEDDDSYLRDDVLAISGAWRDQFQVELIADDSSGSWDQVQLTYWDQSDTWVFPICTIVNSKISSDDRKSAQISSLVAPFGEHSKLSGLFEDDHPQYLTKDRHSGLDHTQFLDGMSKLSGITIFGISGYSDRTLNVDTTQPFVSSATSYDNTHVDVVFSEKVDPVTALNISNYSIAKSVNPDSVLVILSATMLSGANSVRLTTASQENAQYKLTVANVKDTFGNLIDTQESNNMADFAGKL